MTRLKSLAAAASAASLMAISAPAMSQEGGTKMEGMEGMQGMKNIPCCEGMAHGVGVVNSLNEEARKINLTHEPIPAIGWGDMIMDFQTGRMVDLTKFEIGDRVQFALKQGRDQIYRVMMMCKTDAENVIEGLCMKDMNEDGAGPDGSTDQHDQDHQH